MIEAMIVAVPILVVCIFIFTFAMILSPKLRGKFMSRQIRATKYMLDSNEDLLREMSNKSADIASGGVSITARAIKDGLSDMQVYCEYCGKLIDEDSKFCKNCGKEQ